MQCEFCGQELPPERKRFCSRECLENYKRAQTANGGEGRKKPEVAEWRRDIAIPRLQVIEKHRSLKDVPESIQLGNLALTAAALIAAYSLFIFLMTSLIHEGMFVHSEQIILYIQFGYSILLAAFGFGLRKNVTQIEWGLFSLIFVMLLGQTAFAYYVKTYPVIVPIFINAYLLYSTWMFHRKAFEL